MRIKCKLGPIDVQVCNDIVSFQMDDNGQAVAEVVRPEQIVMLLAVEHYSEVPAESPADQIGVVLDPDGDQPSDVAPETPSDALHPLDHDGDGRPGGSRAGKRRPRKA